LISNVCCFFTPHLENWLFKALYEAGFTNKLISANKDDGLKETNIYITAVIRCALPQNKLNKEEINNCLSY